MNRHTLISLAVVAFSCLSAAQSLNKPPLEQNLDYLHQGLLDNLHPTQSTNDQWGTGYIPQDCYNIVENAGLSPYDVQTYNVHYSDCSDAWVMCRHNQSPIDLNTLIDLFGRLPIQMRQYVRHMVALPDPNGGHAYNSNGNIALFADVNDMGVFVHETGHSLDLLGAYADKPLSSSQNWLNNYNMDPNVPDPYSDTNQVEDVAQVTVVSVFNENVPGGFGSVEPNWHNVFHQYATLIGEANDAGQGSSLIKPGENVQCSHRLANSAPIMQSGASSRIKARGLGPLPDVSLSPNVQEIVPLFAFNTSESCTMRW